jgi:oligopeptidase B
MPRKSNPGQKRRKPKHTRGKRASLKNPPRAEKRLVEQVVHGETLTDDYAWLRDSKWREVMRDPTQLDKEIRDYLEAENNYTKSALAKNSSLKKQLIQEMRGRIKEDDSSVPSNDGAYAYFMRYRKGGQHPLLCRNSIASGREEILLNGDKLAKGHAYFHLGSADHSPDHRLLAWSVDDAGSEFNKIRLRELSSRKELSDIILDTTGGVVWSADSRGFFYVWLNADHRPSRVFFHEIGTSQENDTLIYEEPDKGFFVNVGRLQAGVYGVIACGDSETSEVRLLDLTDPFAKPRLIEARKFGVRYEVEHHPSFQGEPTLIIQTNADDCEDFKIVVTPLATPERTHWQDLVPHQPGTMILDSGVFRDWVVRLERR